MTTAEVECISVVRLEKDSWREIKSILYHAYRDEPTFKYLFDDKRAGYDQRVRATIRELIDLYFAHNQDVIGLSLGEKLIAVALIGSPELRMDIADQLNWRIRMMLTAGLSSTNRYIDYHKKVKACLPGETHHTLPLLGVDKNYQGRGFGKTLIQSIEKICDDNPRSSGVGLDTGNAEYFKFYENLGFKKVGQVKLGELTQSVFFKPYQRKA